MGFKDRFKKIFGRGKEDEKTVRETEFESSDNIVLKDSGTVGEVELPADGKVLFVCNGNTDMSPMAEAIFNQKATGQKAFSAGLFAQKGGEASQNAVDVCANHGINLSDHKTRYILDFPVEDMDLVLAVTVLIRDALKMQYPNSRIFTIKEYAGGYSELDISDPFGGNLSDYEECFAEIDDVISRILGVSVGIADKPASVEEIIDSPSKVGNFKYLDDLIRSGVKEVVLDADIVLDDEECEEYGVGIQIDEDIIIDGNGHSIDAREKTRIFSIICNNATLRNITLKNGFTNSKNHGAAIYNKAKLIISNSSFINNRTEGSGGAVYSKEDGGLYIEGSTFHDNYGRWGGAIYSYGKTDITDCIFSDNSAEGYRYNESGGGAVLNETEGVMEISGSTFLNNSLKIKDGGAVHNYGKMNIIRCSFSGNATKLGDGGALHNMGEVTIKDSTFRDNVSKGWAMSGGGAIENSKVMNIENSTFSNNAGKEGGAIKNSGDLTIVSSTFSNNCPEYGGAIDGGGNLKIMGSVFSNNHAKYSGGAISYRGRLLSIDNSSFLGNAAELKGGVLFLRQLGGDVPEININACTFSDNQSNEGSVLYNDEGSINFSDCEISKNHSPNSIIENKDSLEIFNTLLKDNNSKNIISNSGDHSILSISYGEFRDNAAEEFIINNLGKSVYIDKTAFNSDGVMNIHNKTDMTAINIKINSDVKSILNDGYMVIDESNSKFKDKIYGNGRLRSIGDKIDENFDFGYLDDKIHKSLSKEIFLEENICFELYEENFYEGGIVLDIDDLVIDGNGKVIDGAKRSRIFTIVGDNITLRNITFKNGYSHKNYKNPTNNHGGALRVNNDVNLTIENCRFIDDESEDDGGAIFNRRGLVDIHDSEFLDIHAANDGGAIFNDEGRLNIHDSKFCSGEAEDGGAVYNKGMLNIHDSILTGNKAEEYGAIRNEGELNIYNSILSCNASRGVIGNDGCANIFNSNFNDNELTVNSRVIYNCEGCVLNICDSDFSANKCEPGRVIVNLKGKLILSNVTFKDMGSDLGEDKGYVDNQGYVIIKGENFQYPSNSINGGNVFLSSSIRGKMDIGDETNEIKPLQKNQKDFTYLNELIQIESYEIMLENDILLDISKNEEITFSDGIKIDKDNLVIDGNGHSIDAQNISRIFQINARNVQIKNITLKNGFSFKSGGAIHNQGELTVSDSSLTCNKRFSKGGLIGGGGAICNLEELTIINSSFSNNESDKGGGIYNEGDKLFIADSIFSSNVAYDGAIYNMNDSSIFNTTFKDNESHAIYNSGGYLKIEDSIFKGNKCKFDGGAIKNNDELEIIKCTFSDNMSPYGAGGAIENNAKKLIIRDSSFSKNSSKNEGGAINNFYGVLDISHSTFTDNECNNHGGAIFFNNKLDLDIKDCDFKNNRPDDLYDGSG